MAKIIITNVELHTGHRACQADVIVTLETAQFNGTCMVNEKNELNIKHLGWQNARETQEWAAWFMANESNVVQQIVHMLGMTVKEAVAEFDAEEAEWEAAQPKNERK